MKILIFILTLGFAYSGFAVEPAPAPHTDAKAKMEGAQSHGAIKIEKKPAVPPEALKKADEQHSQQLQQQQQVFASAPAPRGEHLFGVHAAVGFPHPVSFGLNYVHSSHYFSAELSTGQYNAKISDIKLGIQNTEAALRWHPWAGSFYLGALLGNQKITAEKTEVISGQEAQAHVEVKANYITPAFGWMWGTQSTGFFAGMEFGYQSPSGATTDFRSNAPLAVQGTQDYQDLEKDVKDKGHDLGKMGLPHVVLLKIGWLF